MVYTYIQKRKPRQPSECECRAAQRFGLRRASAETRTRTALMARPQDLELGFVRQLWDMLLRSAAEISCIKRSGKNAVEP